MSRIESPHVNRIPVAIADIPFPFEVKVTPTTKRGVLETVWGKGNSSFQQIAQSSHGESIWKRIPWENSIIKLDLKQARELLPFTSRAKIGEIRAALEVGTQISHRPEGSEYVFSRQELLQLFVGICAYEVLKTKHRVNLTS